MKNALILTIAELTPFIEGFLHKRGYSTKGLEYEFTPRGVTVIGGVTKMDGTAVYGETTVGDHLPRHTSQPLSINLSLGGPPDGEFDDDGLEDENDDLEDDPTTLSEAILDEVSSTPKTAAELSVALGVSGYPLRLAMSYLKEAGTIEAVAPRRHEGHTVSAFMKTGTETYVEFVANEAARIGSQAERWLQAITEHAPAFYDRRVERPKIVNAVCEGLGEDESEDLRRDARGIFYKLAEQGVLEHKSHRWRVASTDSDDKNVASLQGAVREVLMGADGGMTQSAIVEKFPAPVSEGLMRYAVCRMDDVYEQNSLLHLCGPDENTPDGCDEDDDE